MATIELNNFSGGLTDNIADAQNGTADSCDNFILTPEMRLQTRPGSELVTTQGTNAPSAVKRATTIVDGESIAMISDSGVKVLEGNTWKTATPVAGSSPFSGAGKFATAVSQKQLYISSDSLSHPLQKVIKLPNGNYQLRTAGVPGLESSPSVVGGIYNLHKYMAGICQALESHINSAATFAIASVGSVTGTGGTGTSRTITLQTSVAGLSRFGQILETNGTKIVFSKTTADDGKVSAVENVLTITGNTFTGTKGTASHQITAITGTTGASYATPSAGYKIYVEDWNVAPNTFGVHLAPRMDKVPYSLVSDGTPPTREAMIADINALIAKWTDHIFDAGIEFNGLKLIGARTYHYGVSSACVLKAAELGVSLLDLYMDDNRWAGLTISNLPAEATLNDIYEKLVEIESIYNAHDRDVNPTFDVGGYYGNHNSNAVNGRHQTGTTLADYAPASYLYAFHRTSTYTTNTAEFLDASAVTTISVDRYDPISDGTSATKYPVENVISGIPVLSNSGSTCYDTANMKVRIFRTTNGGTTLRLVGEVTNGTTTFTDDMTDEDLSSQEAIYTTGGVLDNDMPPRAKYLHSTGQTVYYLNINDGTSSFPDRLLQSVPADPDSVPTGNYVDLAADGMGLSSIRNIPVVFTTRGCFRIEGAFDELGRGGMTAISIDPNVGCIPGSVVQMLDGVVWWAPDGVYATDGYRVRKLSEHINDTFAGWAAENSSLVCTYDSVRKLAVWGIRSDSGLTSPDMAVCLDFTASTESRGCFYTWSNLGSIDLLMHDNKLIRVNENGHLVRHINNLVQDVITRPQTAPEAWYGLTVYPEYTSSAIQLNQDSRRAWTTKVTMKMASENGAVIAMSAINDKTGVRNAMQPIALHGTQGVQMETRRFPAGTLRAHHKQIGVSYQKDTLHESADYLNGGKLTVFASGYLVLQYASEIGSNKFGETVLGKLLVINGDPLAKERLITGYAYDHLIVSDHADLVIGSELTFTIVGSSPTSPLVIHSATIHFEPFSESALRSPGVAE